MNDNLKNKAKKLYTKFSDKDMESPQYVYEELTKIANRVKVYFQNIKPADFIKLVFYIWSLLKTNQFDLGERLFNNSYYAKLFINEDEIYKRECDYCGGMSDLTCDNCYGNSNLECDQCQGEGLSYCDECDGDDEDCEECSGTNIKKCDKCGGDGTVNCDKCSYGYVTCPECLGLGEIESDEKKITSILIVTWDNHIKNRCELTVETNRSTLTLDEFENRPGNYIILSTKETHFKTEAVPDKLYCSYYSNDPLILHYLSDMKINTY